jgi:hypothetical protein
VLVWVGVLFTHSSLCTATTILLYAPVATVWKWAPATRSLPQFTLYFDAEDALAPKLARVLMQWLHVDIRMRPSATSTEMSTPSPFLALALTPMQAVATDLQVVFALMKLSPLRLFRVWARICCALRLDSVAEFTWCTVCKLGGVLEALESLLNRILHWQDETRATQWQRRGGWGEANVVRPNGSG